MTEEISHFDSLHLVHVELKHKPFERNGQKLKPLAPSRQRGSMNSMASVVRNNSKPEVAKDLTKKVKCWIRPESVSHTLVQCRSFLAMTVNERWRLAKDKGLCFMCYDNSHTTKGSKTKEKCCQCQKLHHVLYCTDMKLRRSQNLRIMSWAMFIDGQYRGTFLVPVPSILWKKSTSTTVPVLLFLNF